MSCGTILLILIVLAVVVAFAVAGQKGSVPVVTSEEAQPLPPLRLPATPAWGDSPKPAVGTAEAVPSSAGFTVRITPAGYGSHPQQAPKPEEGDRFWIPAGQTTRIGKVTIPGGLLYVGSELPSVSPWRGAEPALIDPALPVDWRRPDREGRLMSYWPSYSTIQSASRAAYLRWLEEGRSAPDAYIGYVFLFFYGLERRLMFDAQGSTQARGERETILAEVERLLGIYGGNHSFRGYARRFLEAGRTLDRIPELDDLRPPVEVGSDGTSFTLRLGLARLAAAGMAIPPDWAFTWLKSWPESRLRTPAQRCPEETRQLFEIRYREKHRGGGLKVKPGKTRLRLSYYPASASLHGKELSVPLPQELFDVSEHTPSLRKLQDLMDQTCQELDAYSRWVGRTGDSDSPAALALLPPELAEGREGESVRQLREWIESRLGAENSALIEATELVRQWPCQTAGKLARREAENLGRFLGSRGFGLEPDPRFGGAVPAQGPAVLFRFPAEVERPPDEPTAEYQGATVLLHLAAAVSAVDGTVTAAEESHLAGHLENALQLGTAERTRLRAHLRWLLAEPPGLAGIKKRIEILPEPHRRSIGQFLITVAGADGSVSAEELKILTKIYGLLGLEAQSVYSDVHALASAAAPPAADAVTVRPATPTPGGFALPAAPGAAPASARGIALDLDKVREKILETEKVSSLLGDIFQEEPAVTAAAPAVTAAAPAVTAPAAPKVPAAPPLAGLDAAHSDLLRQLSERPSWPRLEVERLAGALGLLPEGALELINEAAFERCGAPLLEGDETIEIDRTVLEEILA